MDKIDGSLSYHFCKDRRVTFISSFLCTSVIEFDQCHTISQSVTILEVPPKGSRTAMPLSKEADAARKREQREARSAEAAARSAVTQKKLADEAAAFAAAIARVPLEEEAALAATLPLSKIADVARKRKERGGEAREMSKP